MNKKYGALSSSADPEKLGLTVQSVILGLSSILIVIGGQFGIQLLPADIQGFAAQSATIATQLAIGASAIGTAYGLIRKLVVKFAERK